MVLPQRKRNGQGFNRSGLVNGEFSAAARTAIARDAQDVRYVRGRDVSPFRYVSSVRRDPTQLKPAQSSLIIVGVYIRAMGLARSWPRSPHLLFQVDDLRLRIAWADDRHLSAPFAGLRGCDAQDARSVRERDVSPFRRVSFLRKNPA